jgi:hypothetical protein
VTFACHLAHSQPVPPVGAPAVPPAVPPAVHLPVRSVVRRRWRPPVLSATTTLAIDARPAHAQGR